MPKDFARAGVAVPSACFWLPVCLMLPIPKPCVGSEQCLSNRTIGGTSFMRCYAPRACT